MLKNKNFVKWLNEMLCSSKVSNMAHSLASTALLVRINNDFDVFRHIEVIRILR